MKGFQRAVHEMFINLNKLIVNVNK